MLRAVGKRPERITDWGVWAKLRLRAQQSRQRANRRPLKEAMKTFILLKEIAVLLCCQCTIQYDTGTAWCAEVRLLLLFGYVLCET